MNIFIIGGGASGLIAAIKASKNGNKVTILEKNTKCGKKLLLTGNGRCNFWNSDINVNAYQTSNKDLLAKILAKKQDEVLDFFKAIGIVPKVINGYYYPYSNQATSILNALVNKCLKLKVHIKYEEEVLKIIKKDKFYIYTSNNVYQADKVILATGGKSYPKTGSDGKGYELASSFGHQIKKVLPALVQLRGKENFYKELKGVRCEAILTLLENNKEIKSEQGEVLFTDYGISGICTFNLSSLVARGLDNNYQEEILINFVPWFKGSDNDFQKWLDEQDKKLLNYSLGEILEGFLNYKIINCLLKLIKVDYASKWQDVSKEKIVKLLRHFPLKIIGTNSFKEAEVSSGGVPLEEINVETMESLLVENLYLIGEILDVDGICGGYNLGFAWISGILAGEGVCKK